MITVFINGNLTKDPETRSTQGGKTVVSFTVASNEGKDKTEFVNCTAWDKTGELIAQYCKKGDRMACVGRLQTRSWDDDKGNKRYATEVVVNQFDFPPKREGGNDAPKSPSQFVSNNHAFEDSIPF